MSDPLCWWPTVSYARNPTMSHPFLWWYLSDAGTEDWTCDIFSPATSPSLVVVVARHPSPRYLLEVRYPSATEAVSSWRRWQLLQSRCSEGRMGCWGRGGARGVARGCRKCGGSLLYRLVLMSSAGHNIRGFFTSEVMPFLERTDGAAANSSSSSQSRSDWRWWWERENNKGEVGRGGTEAEEGGGVAAPKQTKQLTTWGFNTTSHRGDED